MLKQTGAKMTTYKADKPDDKLILRKKNGVDAKSKLQYTDVEYTYVQQIYKRRSYSNDKTSDKNKQGTNQRVCLCVVPDVFNDSQYFNE